MSAANILCYEYEWRASNGCELAPVRLIAPGWFADIANAKWLRRIEVRDTRFMGRFMARDSTVREELRYGETVVEQTSVGRVLLSSHRPGSRAQTAVTELRVWRGDRRRSPQSKWKIDDGAWMKATLAETDNSPFAWRFWHLDWAATSGEHSITSRAIWTPPAMCSR